MIIKNFKELSTEVLQKKEKQMKNGIYFVLILMVLIMVFKKFSSISLLLLPFIIVTQQLTEIQKELKSRNTA
jgi:uncharacterized membrane protein